MEKLDYVIRKVETNVYAIDEYSMNYMYVVVGSERALVIDTGTGTGDFRRVVERLVGDRPFDVVCTHGHVDHCGGIGQFETVFIHPDEVGMLTVGNGRDGAISIFNRRRYSARGFAVNPEGSLPFSLDDFQEIDTSKIRFLPVHEGDVFDLGDRCLEVYEVPGHSRGHIELLDRKNGLLFAGDNPSHVLILAVETTDQECAANWLRGAEKMLSLRPYYDRVYAGHICPVPFSFLEDQAELARRVATGSIAPEFMQVDEYKGRLYHYGSAYFTMDPENLKTRDYRRLVHPELY